MILFVSYSGELGGAERLLLDYAASLPPGHDPHLACPPGPLADAARAAGLPVLPRPVRSPFLRGGPRERLAAIARLGAHAREIRALARALDPDLIVTWGMRSAIAASAARARFLFAHNDLLPGPLVGALVRLAARRAAAVVALSRAIADELSPGAIVLHPGVDVQDWAAFDQQPAQPPLAVVLGAIVHWKRPDLALEAVARARRRLPGLRLALIGAPLSGERELLDALRMRAAQPDLAGAVAFEGFVSDPRELLAGATCLLHCAPREPFGLAVLEALAAARPAIVPDACGPAEIVADGCGIRYAPGDVDAAAEALVAVAGDRAVAAEMGRRGRERARHQFDRAAARARFAQIVAAAARQPPPSSAQSAPAPELASAGGAESLAVVTVAHDSAPELAALLRSLARHLPEAEVVVVDCASSDCSLEVARRHPGAKVVALASNAGFARACNLGLDSVTRPVTALLNPDVELLDDSLLALVARARQDDGGRVLLAPRVLNADGSIQDNVHPLPGSPAELARCAIPPALAPGRAAEILAPWRASRPRRVGWAVGCALVARTETLSRLGPFHESLFLYGEDLELGLRAGQDGIQTWLWPAARVLHHRAHSTSAAFGGEPFERLARARHQAIELRRGARAAARDDLAQVATFAERIVLKSALGRSAARERRQLSAAASVRREHRRRARSRA
ncbi:MAG: glycosyltransferase [Solirubrobacteraceae bacterium]